MVRNYSQLPELDWSEYKPDQFTYRGKWIDNWFSNMVVTPFKTHDGVEYASVENFYQSCKAIEWDDRFRISQTKSPSWAKQEGRRINIRKDWEDIKYLSMWTGLCYKFSHQHPDQVKKLLDSNDVIVEWNNWGDRIWGADVKTGKGRNILGIMLMDLRTILISSYRKS